jgi:putative transposase
LGKIISKSSVLNILMESGFPGCNLRQDQSWYRFLKSHGKRFLACDFITVETVFLKRLYVFALMDTSTRKIIAFGVTKNQNVPWLESVIRNTFINRNVFSKYLVSDRDGVYGEWFGKFLKDCYDVSLYRTPPRTPNCCAFIERWNRSVREELLDHRIIFGERDLHILIRQYVDYFKQTRPHQSLGQDSPCRQHGTVQYER